PAALVVAGETARVHGGLVRGEIGKRVVDEYALQVVRAQCSRPLAIEQEAQLEAMRAVLGEPRQLIAGLAECRLRRARKELTAAELQRRHLLPSVDIRSDGDSTGGRQRVWLRRLGFARRVHTRLIDELTHDGREHAHAPAAARARRAAAARLRQWRSAP